MVQENGQVSETKIQQCEIVPALTNMSEQMSDVSEPDQIKYKQLTYCDLHVLPEECDFTQTGNVKHWSHLAIFLVCCFLCGKHHSCFPPRIANGQTNMNP